MRRLSSSPYAALFLFLFCPVVDSSHAEDDWFPYTPGRFWEYEGEVTRVDHHTGQSYHRVLSWRTVVIDVLELGDYRVALVEAPPQFSSWSTAPDDANLHAIVIQAPDGGVYEAAHPDGALFLWHLRASRSPAPPEVFLSAGRYAMRPGMQIGEKFNPLDEAPNRAPGDYNFGVEAIEAISRDLPPRVRALAGENQYRLSLRTNADSQTKTFVPGIGYTEITFEDHRVPSLGQLRLVTTGVNRSGHQQAGLIESGAPIDDAGNFVPTADLIDDFLVASSDNGRLDDFRHIFAERASYFGKRCTVDDIIAGEAKYHDQWPYRSLTRTGPLEVIEQGTDGITFRYQFDFVLGNLERAERKTGRHVMEMGLTEDDQGSWRIASLSKVNEIDVMPRTVMGEKFGNLSSDSTIEGIAAMIGPDNITTEYYTDPEDGTEYATSLIFPDSSGEILVRWVHGKPSQLTITRPDSGFENPGGIKVGMTLREVQNRNHGEIALYGFDWDFGGAMASWKGGRLAREHAIDHLFQATFQPSGPVPQDLQGPVLLSSRDPRVQALDLTISEISYFFPDDPTHIGGLYPDIPSVGVEAMMPEPANLSDEELNSVDGTYRQTWAYPERGVFLEMYSFEPGGEKRVSSVSIEAPCPLKTDRGIGIGAAFEEVALAYADLYSDENAFQDDDTFVAGSIYGGTLFYFENGRVREIFIGAAAE